MTGFMCLVRTVCSRVFLPLSENPVEPDNVNVAFYSEQKSREMSYLV